MLAAFKHIVDDNFFSLPHWYFVAFVVYMLFNVVKFQTKPSNFDGMSKSLAVILDFWIMQGSVATQLRWGERPCNSYTESFLGSPQPKPYWLQGSGSNTVAWVWVTS